MVADITRASTDTVKVSAWAGLRVQGDRLLQRIDDLAQIGAIAGGGVCRLALTDADKAGRDQVVQWMRELGLSLTIDGIGNVVGTWAGTADLPPVMTGSHIDTVATGGRYDGNFGVLAGLEVIQTLQTAGVRLRHPLAVAFFTNEEGARFHPDMMGSMVYQGSLSLADAWATTAHDGSTVEENLRRIGYLGEAPCGHNTLHGFVELHVEQGPVMEQEGITIGAVTGVQGMSWVEYTVQGVSNHAGTTPMRLRHDAGYVAMAIALAARELTHAMGGNQVATVGSMRLHPNLVNVIPNTAVFTLDLRNTDEGLLQEAEHRMAEKIRAIAQAEGVEITSRSLVRLQPVAFDPAMIQLVETTAQTLGFSTQRFPSGAGHDAGILAAQCPTAMIFVPSVAGISHNVKEYTAPEDLLAGANVLLHTLLQLAL